MDDYEQMVADCQNRESKLSDWEIHFIASISSHLDAGHSLTQKQIDKLDAIWERIT